MKKFLAVMLSIAMVGTLSACKSTGGSESQSAGGESGQVKFVMAELNPLETTVGQTDKAFVDKVSELSNGSIAIELHTDGELGSENEILEKMLGGGDTIQLSRISAFALTNYGGEKSKLLSLPYIFEDREHFWNFADSDLAREFLLEPSKKGSGIRGLFYGEEGFRHFFTNKDVKSIDDFKGLKVRVPNDPVMNGMVEELGASPVALDLSSISSAIQDGIVDMAEQPIVDYKANNFDQVANTIILDGHTLGAIQVVMTDKAWNSLTPEQQKVIDEASDYAAQVNRELSEKEEEEILKELEEEGCNIIQVEDKTPWQEAVEEVVDENIEGQEELYQQIRDMAD